MGGGGWGSGGLVGGGGGGVAGGEGVGADVGAHVSATSDKSSIPQLSAMLFWCSHDSVDRVNMYLMSTLLVLTFQAERSCENVVP